MRVASAPAFILHRRPYRNSSFLLEAFACEHGRLGLVARGSKQAGLLQPFRSLLLSWSGKGELVNLTAAEEQGKALTIAPGRFYSALYLNELLLRLLARYDPHPALFDAYRQALQELACADRAEEPALRRFEKKLLTEIGYALSLTHEADNDRPIIAQQKYHYFLDKGPVAINRNREGLVVAGASLLALDADNLTAPEALRDAKRLLRAAIGVHLEGRPLRTRQILAAQRRRLSSALG